MQRLLVHIFSDIFFCCCMFLVEKMKFKERIWNNLPLLKTTCDKKIACWFLLMQQYLDFDVLERRTSSNAMRFLLGELFWLKKLNAKCICLVCHRIHLIGNGFVSIYQPFIPFTLCPISALDRLQTQLLALISPNVIQ